MATRLYEPSWPSATGSACLCLMVRCCLRDLRSSGSSQAASFSAKGSSRLRLTRLAYCGTTVSLRRYLRTVLRDRPVT